MMGKKLVKQARDRSVSAKPLREYIPKNHFLIKVEEAIDFSFIYDEVKGLYSFYGTDSIDPVVVFKMLLIGFLYNIRSERLLVEEIKFNMAYRYFIGYALDEAIPDRAVFTRLRERWGEEVFRRIFDKIVSMCIHANLVGAKSASIDSTLVKAKGPVEVDQLQQEKRIEQYLKDISEINEPIEIQKIKDIKKNCN